MAIASAMGANTIRSTTLGVSVGTRFSVESSLGTFNEEALATIDWAVWAAKSYGMRLIIPLTDQYDYYHGGIPTFLRWRNLSSSSPSDYHPFYDTASDVFGDFTTYVKTLLNHRSNITGLTLAEEPTVLAFETGNELGGYGGKSSPPPVAWTQAVAQLLKQLAPDTLVISGSYGVRKDELSIAEVDIHSDHYYPLYSHNLKKASRLTASHSKAFIAGEFDWTDRYHLPVIYLAVLAPVLLAVIPWLTPGRWWPRRASLRSIILCRCCCCCRARSHGKGRRKAQALEDDQAVPLKASLTQQNMLASSTEGQDGSSDPNLADSNSHNNDSQGFQYSERPSSFLDRPFPIHRWHISVLLIIVLCPIIAGLVSAFLPSSLHSFLSTIESSHDVSGSFYWSLFGRDSQCCQFVNHNDGYTLHYPTDPQAGKTNGNGAKAATLSKHAWKLRGVRPDWLSDGDSVTKLKVDQLPAIVCPQNSLAVPSNSTWVGVNGTLSS